MQGRVREGGDHLAATWFPCKGHTSILRSEPGSCAQFVDGKRVINPAASARLLSVDPRYSRSLLGLTSKPRREFRAFATARMRICNGRAPRATPRGASMAPRKLLTTC